MKKPILMAVLLLSACGNDEYEEFITGELSDSEIAEWCGEQHATLQIFDKSSSKHDIGGKDQTLKLIVIDQLKKFRKKRFDPEDPEDLEKYWAYSDLMEQFQKYREAEVGISQAALDSAGSALFSLFDSLYEARWSWLLGDTSNMSNMELYHEYQELNEKAPEAWDEYTTASDQWKELLNLQIKLRRITYDVICTTAE